MHCQLVNREWRKEGGKGWYRDAWTHFRMLYDQFCICVFCIEMGMLLWYSTTLMYTQHYHCMYAFSHSKHFSLIL